MRVGVSRILTVEIFKLVARSTVGTGLDMLSNYHKFDAIKDLR